MNLAITEEQKEAFLTAHSAEYFWCAREHCLMSRKQCLLNQRIAAGRVKFSTEGVFFGEGACDRATCWGCKQGTRMAREAEGG